MTYTVHCTWIRHNSDIPEGFVSDIHYEHCMRSDVYVHISQKINSEIKI